MSHIVVTGANGFVGRALCRLLLENAHTVTGLVRTPGQCADLIAGPGEPGGFNRRNGFDESGRPNQSNGANPSRGPGKPNGPDEPDKPNEPDEPGEPGKLAGLAGSNHSPYPGHANRTTNRTSKPRPQTPHPARWREWVFRGDDYAGLAAAWPRDLQPDCVIHLAARVHVTKERARDPDAAFWATNVDGALRVAQAADQCGAKRFVFVSSIKALAETDGGAPLREHDEAAPQDAYGRSKLAAEQTLRALHDTTGLDVVTVRPPLVYGPGVRANFLRMMDALWRGLPLPLGAVRARRSLVYVDNLADALLRVATDPRAANQCFHVADDDAPTLPELLRRTAAHLERPAHLLSVPPGWLRAAERLLTGGSTKRTDRLTHSLRVDASHLRATLGWRAPWSLDAGLAATAHWYRATRLVEPVDAIDTADVVDTADTVDTVDTADTVDAVDAIDVVDTADVVDTVDAIDTVNAVDAIDVVDAVDTTSRPAAPLKPAQPAHVTPPPRQGAQPGTPPQAAEHEPRFSAQPVSGRTVPQTAGNRPPGD